MTSMRLALSVPWLSGVASAGAGAGVGAGVGGLPGLGELGRLLPRVLPPFSLPWGRSSLPHSTEPSAEDSVWLAVPKKRTSHQKKRQRQLADRQQDKLVRNLNRCPACGHFKRAHTLCMHCAQEIRNMWRARDRQSPEEQAKKAEEYDPSKLSPEDEALSYPTRPTQPFEHEIKLREREYVLDRPRSRIPRADRLYMRCQSTSPESESKS